MKPVELARISKIDPGAISRMLKGERNPNPETLAAIADALNLPEGIVLRAAIGKKPLGTDDELDAKIKHVVNSYRRESTRKRALRILETLLSEEQEEEVEARGRAVPNTKFASSHKG